MPSPSSPPPKTPKTLKGGRYTLNRTLGVGSQAETYEARDHGVATDRPAPGGLVDEWQRYVTRARRGDTPNPHGLVAIKSFHVGRAKAWKDVELAEREARTLASLVHPNLPRYIEHFEEEGALYLVMEMVEGESLATLRSRHDISSVAEVTRMLRDIGDALRYLHGRAPSVVHRDIKPGNIIRRRDGSYALVDFGAVRDRLKPEGGSTVVGTFGFMAPEQFQGRASPRSDLYGLAATALVMLTGVEPEDLPHVGLGIDVARAVPSSTPRPLVRALASMLAPDPDRRASSIDEALALLDTRPTRAREESRREESRREGALREESARGDSKARAPLSARDRARAARRRKRAAARARRAPFVARIFGKLGLLVALLAVWVTVGLVVPLVLTALSLLFGGSLRRAARACSRAAKRADANLRRASAWLSGHRDELTATPARVRVGSERDRVRVVDDLDVRDDEASDDEAWNVAGEGDEDDEDVEGVERRRRSSKR